MNHDSPNQKPTILRNIGSKLLVAMLCLLSFLAGFYAHQSRQMNYCQFMNQQFEIKQTVVICKPALVQ